MSEDVKVRVMCDMWKMEDVCMKWMLITQYWTQTSLSFFYLLGKT